MSSLLVHASEQLKDAIKLRKPSAVKYKKVLALGIATHLSDPSQVWELESAGILSITGPCVFYSGHGTCVIFPGTMDEVLKKVEQIPVYETVPTPKKVLVKMVAGALQGLYNKEKIEINLTVEFLRTIMAEVDIPYHNKEQLTGMVWCKKLGIKMLPAAKNDYWFTETGPMMYIIWNIQFAAKIARPDIDDQILQEGIDLYNIREVIES